MTETPLAFALPGDLATPTGGYAYARAVLAEWRANGRAVDIVALPGSFPAPMPADWAATEAALAAIPAGQPLMVDGLAFGVMDRLAPGLASRHPLIALCHHPLALETGLDADTVARLMASEAAALAAAHRVVVTSPTTAATLIERFGVDRGRITVALPGVKPAAPARGSGGPRVRLLSVGTITPRKGHDVLIRALERIAHLPWDLVLAGDPTRSPETADALAAQIAAAGLSDRVTLIGAVDEAALAGLYDAADLFVLASHYEGYGMVYAEAISHGLPVVGTTGGAIPDAVPESAGRLVTPGDDAALAAVLGELIVSPRARAALSAGARAVQAQQPRWSDAARAIDRAVALAMVDHAGTGFSVEWLTLREPFDHAARDAGLVRVVASDLPQRPVRIIDLASGAGSTLKALAPVIARPQRWRLVDHDPVLMEAARRNAGGLAGLTIETDARDLITDAGGALAPFADGPADLITTSAFLDLVSEPWVHALVGAVATLGAPFYAALSYDGRTDLSPPHPLDAAVIDAMNRHQQTDKGFGPAMGPLSAVITERLFRAVGYRVRLARSDWVFAPGDTAIQRAMVEGWSRAAAEIGGIEPEALAAWARARLDAIEAGTSQMRVGHLDLYALPGGR